MPEGGVDADGEGGFNAKVEPVLKERQVNPVV